MWQMIELKGPPTRLSRFCCEKLKETGGKNRAIVTGVRRDESQQRQDRTDFEVYGKSKREAYRIDRDTATEVFEAADPHALIEHDDAFIRACRVKGKTVCNPILDWTNADVWNYIRSECLDYNPLYNEGFCRVGCVGCPMAAKGRRKEFARWPAYEKMYRMAFQRFLDRYASLGKAAPWANVDELWHWWMEDGVLPDQIRMEGMDDGQASD